MKSWWILNKYIISFLKGRLGDSWFKLEQHGLEDKDTGPENVTGADQSSVSSDETGVNSCYLISQELLWFQTLPTVDPQMFLWFRLSTPTRSLNNLFDSMSRDGFLLPETKTWQTHKTKQSQKMPWYPNLAVQRGNNFSHLWDLWEQVLFRCIFSLCR